MGSSAVATKVVRPFDPWGNPLCDCPPKFSLNPYTGCGHSCLYCYTTAYIKNAFSPRPKKGLVRMVVMDLRRIPKGSVISLSNSSDPYTLPEEKLRLTREVLEVLARGKYRLLITTKSPLVVRDVDILRRTPSVVSLTVTTMDELVAKIVEPRAFSPRERIKAVKMLSEQGIPTVVRLDPIVPGVNDDERSLREVVRAAAREGAKHITSSTYKARADSLNRLISALPNKSELLKELYLRRGERMFGYMYLPKRVREDVLKLVRDVALEEGLTFKTCREGIRWLDSRGTYCDGSHLLPADVAH